MKRFLPWLLLAAGGGAAWGLAFGEEGWLVVPWVAVAPLLLALSHRRAGWLGFVFGGAFWITSIPWIVRVLVTYGGLPWAASVPLWLLLVAYLAAYPALFAVLGRRLWLHPRLTVPLVALPALWVALEWLRAHLISGFPWNLAGYAWVEVAGALPLSAWIGIYGISFLVLFANTGVALALARRRWEPAAVGVLVPLLLLAAGGRWGGGRPAWSEPGLPAPVALLQPDTAIELQPEAATILANYRKLLRMSAEVCEPGTLLIWPESASWPYVWAEHPRLRRDVEALTRRGCSVLLSSVQPEAGSFYNSVFLVGPSGVVGRYDKRHLVPFGEYVPFAGVFGFLDKLARNAGAFLTGTSASLLPWGGERLGMAICFEVVFPAEVAELVREGATVLVTVTNDGWYGDTSAPWQHLRAARFRAAESRRPMLRAALTGVSAVITSEGALLTSLGPFEEGTLRARVVGRTDLSPASRRPWRVPLAATLLAVAGLGAGWWRARSR
jgi:apolipoprotein N-acyltransferase